MQHAESLHRSRKASQFVRDLISLVLHHMLVVESLPSVTNPHRRRVGGSPLRMASDKVRDRVKRMIEDGRRNPAYYVPSKPEKDFRYPKPSRLHFPMTAEKLKDDILTRHAAVKAELAADEG